VRRRRLERQLGAYRDGELSPERREGLTQHLERDADAGRLLARGEALSRVVREAWIDGPPVPDTEQLLAGLRPELARVDAEIESGHGAWTTAIRRAFAISPTPALAGAAALVVAALLFFSLSPTGIGGTAVAAAEPTIYALDADFPLLVFEPEDEDAATVIWVLEGSDDLSQDLVAGGGFG
jgi:anti-sigma factor RsiW